MASESDTTLVSAAEDTAFLDQLPAALLATILTKLDLPSVCSVASTCTAFRSIASQILSFIPTFHLLDIAPTIDMLRNLMPPNRSLRSLKLDCERLNDSAIPTLLRPSLHELYLLNCGSFSGKLLSEIGTVCKELRSLCLGSIGETRPLDINISALGELLVGCSQLEALVLLFDVSFFRDPDFAQLWSSASPKLTNLEILYISSIMMTELLSPNIGFNQSNHIQPSILPNIQKLCLTVDYITDTLVTTISKVLVSLSHLDLRDCPFIEPSITLDLTNNGLQQINQHGRLKSLSLIRSQEFLLTYFRRVNDLGLLLMADKCANMESICLGGFCRVTDTGFKTIFHACSKLYKLKVSHGVQLTDLVFHDISATSLSLQHVSLRWCSLLTDEAVVNLASNKDLKVLDLRCCRSLGDEALQAIGTMPKLKSLLLDSSDISDEGLSFLKTRVVKSLVSLSLRGCKRLTDKCIPALFDGCSVKELRELDVSNLPNLSDNAILSLAKYRIPLSELRIRQCPLIGDTSVMALASMQVDEERWHGNCLRLLDLCDCGGLTQLSFRWLKKPYFPRLRWLGVTGILHRDMVDALARNRPFLNVTCTGDEIGSEQWDKCDDFSSHDHYYEEDELEQWLLEGDPYTDDEEMFDAEEE